MDSRPLKWHGGKQYLAKWHQDIAKRARKYTTRAYGCMGGWGEGWTWDHEGIAEVCNDLNGALTNFWRVLQSPAKFPEFQRIVQAVPFSEPEWKDAWADDEARKHWTIGIHPDLYTPNISAAVSFFIRYRQSRQGLGDNFATLTKKRTRGGMQEQVSAWLSCINGLSAAHRRLIRVLIVNPMKVWDFVKKYDDPNTLFYLDVPYYPDTRKVPDAYEFEMSCQEHDTLLDVLADIKGQFMLCGYSNDLYEAWRAAMGWNRYDMEIDNKSSSSKTKEIKIESVWANF